MAPSTRARRCTHVWDDMAWQKSTSCVHGHLFYPSDTHICVRFHLYRCWWCKKNLCCMIANTMSYPMSNVYLWFIHHHSCTIRVSFPIRLQYDKAHRQFWPHIRYLRLFVWYRANMTYWTCWTRDIRVKFCSLTFTIKKKWRLFFHILSTLPV